MGALEVRFVAEDIGEVKQWAMEGKDDVRFSSWDEETFWQVDSLQLALNLVPDLVDAIERCRMANRWAEVVVMPGAVGTPVPDPTREDET